MIQKFLLFTFFMMLACTGFWLVWRRTGDYDADYITKIIGWLVLLPAIWGLLEIFQFV